MERGLASPMGESEPLLLAGLREITAGTALGGKVPLDLRQCRRYVRRAFAESGLIATAVGSRLDEVDLAPTEAVGTESVESWRCTPSACGAPLRERL
jgi:hypothetical protein